MKAFCEKGDLVLRTLNISSPLTWHEFTRQTEIPCRDAVLEFLKNKGFIEYTDEYLNITNKGVDFINSTSFVAQRDNLLKV